MKYRNCVICAAADHKVVYKTKEKNGVFSQKVVCKSCGLIFQNPTFTEEELRNIYLTSYWKFAESDLFSPAERVLGEKRYRANDQIKWLERFLSLDGFSHGKKVLEVGSSFGLLLNSFKEKGWQVEGVEPAKNFAEYVKNTYGIKVHQNFLENVDLEKSTYDLIILSHVLEHLPDPVSTLSRLAAHLKPDGFLFIEIPNVKGLWKNLGDQFQSSHLFIPSVNTMQRLIAKAGLKISKMETKGRIIRCLLRLPHIKGTPADNRLLPPEFKKDNYMILSLRIRLQRLTSWIFRKIFFGNSVKDGLLSNTIIFTFSNYISTGLSFFSSFVIRKVLGPLTMGLYSELMIVLEYGKFHHLGMINALEREVPFYLGKKELQRVEEIKKTILAFISFSAFNVGMLLFIISFFAGSHRIGLRFVALLILIETIISFYEALLQSYNRFKSWSIFIIFIGILEVLLKIVFVIKFGFNGLLVSMALTGLITIATYHYWGKCRVDLRAKIHLKEVARLLKLGLPLIVFRIMYLLSMSVDKLAIIFFLGRLQLGYYSIATMVYNYLTLLPKFSYKTLYPKFMEAFGKKEDIEDVKKYLIIPNRVFACFFSVLVGLAIIILPFFVAYLLPRFKNGILPAQIVAFTSFFSVLIYTWNYLLIALYEQKRLAGLYGISVIIAVVINVFFIKVLNLHIAGVALATLISQFLFTTLLICYGYRYYTRSVLEHLKLLYSLYFPSVLIVLAFILTVEYYPRIVSVKKDLLDMAVGCAIFLIVASPLIYQTVKRDKLLGRLFMSKEAKNA